MRLDQRAFDAEHPITTHEFGDQRPRRREGFNSLFLGDILIFGGRLEDDDLDILQITQSRLDFRPHLVPLQTAVAAAERRQRD